MMRAQIVVSRYNEEIAWLPQYAAGVSAHVYNKGNCIDMPPGITCSQLENVGREAHTILTHIVQNYGSIADVTIFLQGRIDDLGGDVYDAPQKYFIDALHYGFSVPSPTVYAPHHWKDIDFEADSRYRDAWRSGSLRRCHLGLVDYANKYLGPLPLLTVVSFKGCFAASRSAIHQYPISFYNDLLKDLESHSNPVEGHYLERLWCYMFGRNRMLNSVLKLSPALQGRFNA